MRGGVPVLSRPVVKPKRERLSVKPKAPPSPNLPQGASNSPINILPPKKVPVVRTTERTGIMRPRSVTMPITFCLFPVLEASVANTTSIYQDSANSIIHLGTQATHYTYWTG